MLELLDQRETLQATAVGQPRRVGRRPRLEASFEETVAAEWKVIDVEIAAKEARKADIAPLVPDGLHDSLRRSPPARPRCRSPARSMGSAGDATSGCLPPSLIEALAEDPPRCVHCRRIVVP